MRNTITKIVSLMTVVFSSTVMAVAPGNYVGFNVGMGNTNVKSSGSSKTSSNTELGGGVDFGYQFTRYGAFDFGYTHWANGKSTNVPSCGSPIIHNDSINLVGKAILPLASFGVMGEAGLGVLRSSGGGTCGTSNSKTTISVKPLLGVGITYDLTQQAVFDLTYTRLFVNNSKVSNTNLLALGLSYHFVDVYCGQFLC